MADLHLSDERDTLKMVGETLRVAQWALLALYPHDTRHSERLQRLLDDVNRQRPVSNDGRHGNLHTETCGCEDK